MRANVVYVAQVKQVAFNLIYILYVYGMITLQNQTIGYQREVGRRGTLGQIARPKWIKKNTSKNDLIKSRVLTWQLFI